MLDICDTAGQEEYSAFREQNTLAGDGILIVYDITNRDSLREAMTICEWTKAVRDEDSVPVVSAENIDCIRIKFIPDLNQSAKLSWSVSF